MTALDIDHLRQWVGRTEQAAEVVTPALVQRYDATFDRAGAVVPGAVAPLMLHLCLAQPTTPTASLGEDGHPARGGFLPPVPLPRRMWAGGALEFTDDIRIGEVLLRVSNIRDITLKEGRSGALCFVTVDHAIYSGARPVIRERQDIVYRAAELPGTAKVPSPAPTPMGAFHRSVTASAPLLFRYSALTFNGHRIHYDLAYARDVEGYPGLVVHGPMQAAMLALYAQELRGRRPGRFSFRSLSPVFDTDDFTLNADEDAGALRLWVRRADGAVAMEARAEW